MLPNPKSQAELQKQRLKLANSYTALYDEFASDDLQTVGNYQIERLIGKGSFGKVYLATHKLTNGTQVVLKSANKGDANLAREIHHHRQFLHPHIVRLYEVIVTETLVWLVLEYCPGDELYTYLTQTGPLRPSLVQRIFSQILGAVSYVHSKSCVHRDLKLENILLDKHQNVKLADFGFTREYEGKANYLQTWCGTVCYSAPEMLKGEKYAGEKVDVWSLGVILYALLCGELPFDHDDESETKVKILKEEPNYPQSIPVEAKDLIILMLSKRPLLRPSLSDILLSPWLAEHAPQQQAILKLQQPAPFTTQLEKDTLQRMRSAGVNIDLVIENVFSQRCDSLAGWWALLLDKEERKLKRRERKKKERDAEARASRRISAASARLERIAPTINETEEESATSTAAAGIIADRGREQIRANGSQVLDKSIEKSLDKVPEVRTPEKGLPPTPSTPATNIRRPVRATSGSRRRSQLGPKDYSKRNSGLSFIGPNQEVITTEPPKRKRRYQQPFMHQLASIKHWFNQTAKRSKSPGQRHEDGLLSPVAVRSKADDDLHRVHSDTSVTRRSMSQQRPELASRSTYPARPRVLTNASAGSGRRPSHSPSPLTPSSSYRRSKGGGLRGRKSTSSSVSSMRSIHAHHHSVSIASSSSSASASVASPSLSAGNTMSRSRRASPNMSNLKVLPKTPGVSSSLLGESSGSGLRPSPKPLILSETVNPFTGAGPPSPGLMFARRKRTPFKGPMLGPGLSARRRSAGDPLRKDSIKSNRSGARIIEEEDEEDEIEEVDAFSPLESPELGSDTFVEEPGSASEKGRADEGGGVGETPKLQLQQSSPIVLEEETFKALERG